MRADILNAFLHGALGTLTSELRGPVTRNGLQLDVSEAISDEVTVLVSLVGAMRGMLLIGMSTDTARRVAATMIGEPQAELTEMGLSALAELGNLIAGKSLGPLEQIGLNVDITPPTIMLGHRTRISTLGIRRFVIPLFCPCGTIHVNVAAEVVTL